MQVNFSSPNFKGTYRFHYGCKAPNTMDKFQDVKFFCSVYNGEHNSYATNYMERAKNPDLQGARVIANVVINDSLDSELESYCNTMGIAFNKIS